MRQVTIKSGTHQIVVTIDPELVGMQATYYVNSGETSIDRRWKGRTLAGLLRWANSVAPGRWVAEHFGGIAYSAAWQVEEEA